MGLVPLGHSHRRLIDGRVGFGRAGRRCGSSNMKRYRRRIRLMVEERERGWVEGGGYRIDDDGSDRFVVVVVVVVVVVSFLVFFCYRGITSVLF